MSHPLLALLPAVGLGTRCGRLPCTPKCLVPLAGEPLLGRWLRQLEGAFCEPVLINTHYLAEQVEAFLQRRPASPLHVHTIHEPELLDTAGILLVNRWLFEGATGLLVHAYNAMAAIFRACWPHTQSVPPLACSRCSPSAPISRAFLRSFRNSSKYCYSHE